MEQGMYTRRHAMALATRIAREAEAAMFAPSILEVDAVPLLRLRAAAKLYDPEFLDFAARTLEQVEAFIDTRIIGRGPYDRTAMAVNFPFLAGRCRAELSGTLDIAERHIGDASPAYARRALTQFGNWISVLTTGINKERLHGTEADRKLLLRAASLMLDRTGVGEYLVYPLALASSMIRSDLDDYDPVLHDWVAPVLLAPRVTDLETKLDDLAWRHWSEWPK